MKREVVIKISTYLGFTDCLSTFASKKKNHFLTFSFLSFFVNKIFVKKVLV